MKGLISFFAVTAIVLTISATAFAATSNVKVSGDEKSTSVTFSYSTDSQTTAEQSIKNLMTNLKNLTSENSITQEITVLSESADLEPVTFSLRLEAAPQATAKTGPVQATATPGAKIYTAFDYYNITVSDEQGNLLYSDNDSKQNNIGTTYKDIPLSVLNNNGKSSDTEKYVITVSVNKEASDKASAAGKLDWKLVADGYSKVSVTSSTPTAAATATPVVSASATASAATEAPTAAAVSEAPKATEKTRTNGELSAGTYKVGEDIAAGRYRLTGDGSVKVYNPDGSLRTNIKLTTEDNSTTAVKSYVLNLSDGNTVEVSGKIAYEPYSPSKATAAPSRASASPKATAKMAAVKSTVKPSASPSATAKKNPKTGDVVPIAVVSGIGLASFAAIAMIEFNKKRRGQ